MGAPAKGRFSVTKHMLLIAACAVALGACNKSPNVDAKDATPEEVAKKVRESGADQIVMNPGLWESKVTIEKFDVPGMPAEMAQMMKSKMAENQATGHTFCLRPEEARKPKEDFFAGKNNECRYDHFTMGDGKIDAAMHCGKDAGASAMRMAGTYSPNSYQMQMSTEASAGGEAGQAMQMQMRVEARRVGECSAKRG